MFHICTWTIYKILDKRGCVCVCVGVGGGGPLRWPLVMILTQTGAVEKSQWSGFHCCCYLSYSLSSSPLIGPMC